EQLGARPRGTRPLEGGVESVLRIERADRLAVFARQGERWRRRRSMGAILGGTGAGERRPKMSSGVGHRSGLWEPGCSGKSDAQSRHERTVLDKKGPTLTTRTRRST